MKISLRVDFTQEETKAIGKMAREVCSAAGEGNDIQETFRGKALPAHIDKDLDIQFGKKSFENILGAWTDFVKVGLVMAPLFKTVVIPAWEKWEKKFKNISKDIKVIHLEKEEKEAA